MNIFNRTLREVVRDVRETDWKKKLFRLKTMNAKLTDIIKIPDWD